MIASSVAKEYETLENDNTVIHAFFDARMVKENPCFCDRNVLARNYHVQVGIGASVP